MTDHLERLRDDLSIATVIPSMKRHCDDVATLLAERDSLAALLAEAEKALDGVPAFFYGMALKNAPFKDETKRGFEKWGDELAALLSKIAQQKDGGARLQPKEPRHEG